MQKDKKKSIWTKDFIGITIINFLIFSGFQMLIPTLPLYVKSLGGTNTVIGWITGITTIACILIRPVAGNYLDKNGRKWVFLIGLGVVVSATFSYKWLPMIGALLALRFIHGLGWGVASTASNTVATDIIPKERFGEGMGYFSLSGSIAMAMAPGIGLFVYGHSGVTGLTQLSAALVIAAMILAYFIHYRAVEKQENSMKKKMPYERASFRPSFIMMFVTVTFGSITGFISLYAMDQGISNIGLFFMVYSAAILLTRPVFGRLIDRLGFDVAMYPGLIALFVAMVLLSQAATMSMFLVVAFVYGVGFGAVLSSLQTMAVINAPKDRLGAANATFFTGFDAGIGVGAVAGGVIATMWGYSQMFLTFSLLLIVVGILYFFTGMKRDKSGNSKETVVNP